MTRMQDSLKQHSGWYFTQIMLAKRGEAVPYDPKMGISEADYNKMMVLMKQMELRQKGVATLHVNATDSGKYIHLTGDTTAFAGFYLKPGYKKLKVPFATLKYKGKIEGTDEQYITGPFPAHHWKKIGTDLWTNDIEAYLTFFLQDFYMGILKNTGEGIIYYKNYSTTNGISNNTYIVLTFAIN